MSGEERIIIQYQQESMVALALHRFTGNNKPIKDALKEAIEEQKEAIGFNYVPITSTHRILDLFYSQFYLCTECGKSNYLNEKEILLRTGNLVCRDCQEISWR